MSRNLGSADRGIRVVLGIVLLSLVMVGPGTAWGYLGLIPLVTGIYGFCPLYRLFGWSTAGRGGPSSPTGAG